MARRKSLIRLPFSKVKINKNTVFNIIGFLLIGISLVFILSYIKSFSSITGGRVLYMINQYVTSRFGWLSVIMPIILILISGHFFNSKKLKIVKPNMTGGIIMVFISLLGIFQSGTYGKIILDNLSLDFSLLGAVIILAIIFIIGLILFLDTSIDVFLIFIFDILKGIFVFFKNYLFRSSFDKDGKVNEKTKSGEQQFILDKKAEERAKIPPMPVAQKGNIAPLNKDNLINIRPLPTSSKTSTWIYPPISLLADVAQKEADRGDVNYNANIIEKTLDSFGIRARVKEINRGPAVTQYALEITMGTKLSRITALSNDLALALAATTGQVRIEAPIPGRAMVGIEIPNKRPVSFVSLPVLS